jgi:hypothetical protein
MLAVLFFASQARAARPSISITVTGSWSKTIDASDLIAGAGSDLISSYESASDAVNISISGTTGPSDTWRVDIKKQDSNWPKSFIVWVRRTSSGTGGSVSGGLAYQQVTKFKTTFFDGSDDVTGINIQLKLTGVSIIAYDTYLTTFVYTLVDTK